VPSELTHPRLRPLEVKWLPEDGQPRLFLRDPSGIAPSPATVPSWVGVLLSFCDGDHDLAAIRTGFQRRTGQALAPDLLRSLLQQLDQALFLEGPRLEAARRRLLDEYRSAAHRPPALADQVYPGEVGALAAALEGYGRGVGEAAPAAIEPPARLRGIVSPHIDYQRGGPIYYQTWQRAAAAVQDAEIVILFGTDHSGGPGQVTLTRQHYATPFGVLPTATDVVDALAEAIGPEAAFAEELHHRKEHSIELASVWLHHERTGAPPPVVPILCGSFYYYTNGDADPATDEHLERTIQTLRAATAGKRTLAVAAADLAHVGPAFGDAQPLAAEDRRRLAEKDDRLLTAVCAGDAEDFFGQLRAERDERRVCGLPPMYLMLRFLEGARGTVVGYDQCPADAAGGSLVSIAGVLLE
jgi:AmmeMemoRadiSam system protein B